MANANTTKREINEIERVFVEITKTLNEATDVGQNNKLFNLHYGTVDYYDTLNTLGRWEKQITTQKPYPFHDSKVHHATVISLDHKTPQTIENLLLELIRNSGLPLEQINKPSSHTGKDFSFEINSNETFQESYNLENATKLLELVNQKKQQFSQLTLADAFDKMLNSPAAKANPEQLAKLLGASTAVEAAAAATVPTEEKEPEIGA